MTEHGSGRRGNQAWGRGGGICRTPGPELSWDAGHRPTRLSLEGSSPYQLTLNPAVLSLTWAPGCYSLLGKAREMWACEAGANGKGMRRKQRIFTCRDPCPHPPTHPPGTCDEPGWLVSGKANWARS